MTLYVKKPIPIEAIQWTGTNLPEVLQFTGKHPKWDKWFKDFNEYEEFVRKDRNVFKIITNHGTVEAVPGDWVLRSPSGEHYPISNELFMQTYQLVDQVREDIIKDIDKNISSINNLPRSREHSLAITKLEEAKHWIAY